jgi:cytochrome c-type biogenesis protein CcmH
MHDKLNALPMKSVRYFALAVLLAAALLGAFSGRALAQDPQPPSDDQVNAVAKELYCPVCENIPLDVCPTQACAQWRELIRLKLSQGWSEDDIRSYFAEQYGDRVLAAPPLQGFNWVFYVLLGVFAIFAVVVYIRVVRNLKAKSTAADASAIASQPAEQDDYLKRMEEELNRREKSS